ncbi:sensor histidine kinase [Epilithonimonas vandammei]|uniref:histidine kinase n=1 Tax=Epilithonimonas vandammei TaxID=2487072 RepID=A0A3G8YEW9_9FLAO|nr:sensor histidine kinase [Epilithonimonas vandammei]AZI39496.1 sensor histidine kinase [Epilithonimonas vandammei]
MKLKLVFCFFSILLGVFAWTQETKFSYQDNIEKLLIAKNSQTIIDFVNVKLKHSKNEKEINLLLCYKMEALMHFELYNDAILLSDKIVNSANNFPEVLLQTFILRELNFEILENFKEASKELDKAEKLLAAHAKLKPKFYIHFLIRKSSLMRLLHKKNYQNLSLQAISYSDSTTYKNHLSSAYLLMGIYYRDNDFNKSLSYYEKAKNQCYLNGDDDGFILLNINASKLFLKKGDLPNTKKYLDIATQHINKTNRNYTKSVLFEKKSDYFFEKKQYDSAYINYRKFKEYDDRYDFSKKKMLLEEREFIIENNRQIALRNQATKNARITSIILLFVVLLLVVLGFLLRKILKINKQIIRQKLTLEQNSEKLEKLLNNRIFLLKEMNHRIKNNLAIILSLVNIQKNDSKDEKNKVRFDALYRRIHTIALAQDLYKYDFEANETRVLDLKKYFIDILQSIIHSNTKKIEYEMQAEDGIMISTADALPSGLILNELLTNSYKHSQNQNNDQLKVFISLKIEQNQIIIEYYDNGTNFEQEIRKDNIGLELIEGMVKQMNGQMERKKFNYKISF